MAEDIGTKFVGETTTKKLFRTTLFPVDIIPCSVKGNQAATYLMGSAMIDDTVNKGCKKKYLNGGSTTGACILMRDITTTVGGGNVTEDACRDGSLDSALVLDLSGAAVDAAFKTALPKVSFD